MIYDCFPFCDELELLELRLHELAEVVDRFVLVEATQTHTNLPKPLFFQENRARFAEFADRIIHVIVDDLPVVSDPWIPDRFQRNCIARGLTGCCPEDWVLVSDVDEIPRARAVQTICREERFSGSSGSRLFHQALNSKLARSMLGRRGIRRIWRKNNPFVWRFENRMYCYYLNCRAPMPWHGTRAVRFRDFSSAEEVFRSGYRTVPDAGWHFTWMGGIDRIRDKLAATAHQEKNRPQYSDPAYLARTISAGKPLFDADGEFTFVSLDDSFPRWLYEHPERFSGLLKPVGTGEAPAG